VRRCMLAHIAWFWMFGAFGAPDTVANRIAGVRLAALSPTGGAASGQYPFLGTLMMVRLAVELVQYIRLRRRSSAVAAAAAAAASSQPSRLAPTASATGAADAKSREGGAPSQPENPESAEVNTGVCALCLEPRTHPAAVNCGHVFCWACVAAVVDSAPAASAPPARGAGGGGTAPYRGARCPLCREPLRAESVVPLRNLAVLDDTH
jgi:hypothetical protein